MVLFSFDLTLEFASIFECEGEPAVKIVALHGQLVHLIRQLLNVTDEILHGNHL